MTREELIRANLAKNFFVQKGEFAELDTIELASKGKLMSCFGNNNGSVYTTLFLPPAPNQDNAKGNKEREWDDEKKTEFMDISKPIYPANPYFSPAGWQYKLRADEVIVLITNLPPDCKYYSFINYIMFTEIKKNKDYTKEKGFFKVGCEETGFYHPIFGSIGSSVNLANAKSENGEKFSNKTVIVIGANKTSTELVIKELVEIGYSEEMINLMTIPADVYRMGVEKGSDTFCLIGRISQPANLDDYKAYMDNLTAESIVLRITPRNELSDNPYTNEIITPRGNGIHEVAMLKNAEEHLDIIRKGIIDKYKDEYDYEELTSDIAVPEGLTAYTKDTNAQGDNKDTSYLMTDNFTLNSDEDFIVVYGVNHTLLGKAKYSNAVLYARPMLNGVCSVYDSLFAGTADEYLKDCEDSDKYYVYKMARKQMDENTRIIEFSTGNEKGKYYGVDNQNPILMAFRAYVDKTGVGPSYYEIIYDRTIVFHKKK